MTIDNIERDQAICADFLKGKTMPEIGKERNMSRQNVQQILLKHNIDASMGGRSVKKLQSPKYISPEKKQEIFDLECQTKWGCTASEFLFLRKVPKDDTVSPYMRFIQHRNNVRKMDKVKPLWFLTLKQWWDIWSNSGKYNQRGKFRDAYCLTRKDRLKPYTVDNCHIEMVGINVHRTRGDSGFFKEKVKVLKNTKKLDVNGNPIPRKPRKTKQQKLEELAQRLADENKTKLANDLERDSREE